MSSISLEVQPLLLEDHPVYGGIPFPLILECRDSSASLSQAVEWAREWKDDLVQQAFTHGTVLFRNFPIDSVQDFDQFIQAFELTNFSYKDSLSNAVRVNHTERVFTANEAPPEVTIFFHHEMAQTPIYPSKLFFYCDKAAEQGGATPLCRSDLLLNRLEEECPEFVQQCETLGLKYTNVMPACDDAGSGMGRSWKSTFTVNTKEEAEQKMTQLGYTWVWEEDDCLRATTPVLPAVKDLGDGRKSFFNQLIAAFQGWKDTRNDPAKAITLGDGTPLDQAAVNRASEIAEELAFDVPWQKGDIALVDNLVAMHARRSFQGTRAVFASLVASEE